MQSESMRARMLSGLSTCHIVGQSLMYRATYMLTCCYGGAMHVAGNVSLQAYVLNSDVILFGCIVCVHFYMLSSLCAP